MGGTEVEFRDFSFLIPPIPYRIMPTSEHYAVSITIQGSIINNPDADFLEGCLEVLFEEFPTVPEETMRSIFAYEYERRMRDRHLEYSKKGHELFVEYLDAVDDPDYFGIILTTMATDLALSPALLARIILETQYCVNAGVDGESFTRDAITEMLKKPKLIPDVRLYLEVRGCLINDDYYGPEVDALKHTVGDQYECLLRYQGAQLGMKFIEEVGSRGVGFDKTPDLRLEEPAYLDGTSINWIESKAMFAGHELHQSYVIQQYARYFARFGPGLVIYWYGHVDTILFTTNLDIIISLDLPVDSITMKKPEEMSRLEKSIRPAAARFGAASTRF